MQQQVPGCYERLVPREETWALLVPGLVLNVPQHGFLDVRTATHLVIDLETCVCVETVVVDVVGDVVEGVESVVDVVDV